MFMGGSMGILHAAPPFELCAVKWCVQCLFNNLQKLPGEQVIGSASVINLELTLESLLKMPETFMERFKHL